DREPPFADDREEGIDRRLCLARLDLRDEARRHSQGPRELAQSDLLLLARYAQSLAQVVSKTLPIERGSLVESQSRSASLFACRLCVHHAQPVLARCSAVNCRPS